MLRRLLLILALPMACLPAQSLGWQFGLGTSYDYGVSLPDIPGYKPYGKGQSAAITFDATLGIPIGQRLCLYPSYQFSIPSRMLPVQNLQGDDMPGGAHLSLPFSDENPYEIYGDNYYGTQAKADVWQHKWGTYAMLHIGSGVELGSGLFWRQKRAHVYQPVVYDAYDYVGSDGTQTDEYYYDATYTDHIEQSEFRSSRLAIPLVMQWRYQGNGYYVLTALTRWMSDDDGYWSFRYGMGFHF